MHSSVVYNYREKPQLTMKCACYSFWVHTARILAECHRIFFSIFSHSMLLPSLSLRECGSQHGYPTLFTQLPELASR